MVNVANHRISGAVIAGGKNKRFPYLKGFLKINGITLVEKNLELLGSFCNEVFINTNTPEFYSGHKHIMCGDVFPSRGPMSGIHAALLNAANDDLFVIACDMPFFNKDLLSFILLKHFESLALGAYDATIPVCHGKAQPLCGIYRKTILPSLERHIVEHRNSMYLYLSEINTNLISEIEIREIDPSGNSFININTMDDYHKIRSREGELILMI